MCKRANKPARLSRFYFQAEAAAEARACRAQTLRVRVGVKKANQCKMSRLRPRRFSGQNRSKNCVPYGNWNSDNRKFNFNWNNPDNTNDNLRSRPSVKVYLPAAVWPSGRTLNRRNLVRAKDRLDTGNIASYRRLIMKHGSTKTDK